LNVKKNETIRNRKFSLVQDTTWFSVCWIFWLYFHCQPCWYASNTL